LTACKIEEQPWNLERVGRSRHRRCDPGRVHRLLHPQCLATSARNIQFDGEMRALAFFRRTSFHYTGVLNL